MNMKFFILTLMSIFVFGCTSEQTRVNKMTHATVMITNLAENSGGSGTILASSDGASAILTNSHVCEVVRKGGTVHSHLGKSFVTQYRQSPAHDLCIITVKDNLGVSTKVANSTSGAYDEATVSGHPHLLPTIVTKGWFSTNMVVKVMTKLQPCTEEQAEDPAIGLFCAFLGGIPVIKSYEATPVSALIQAGSSGSAVYNSNGEIAAVVFAGSGEIGYGLTVPHKYVRDFVNNGGFKDAESKTPEFENPLISGTETPKGKWAEKLKEACKQATTEGQKRLCTEFQEALKYSLMSK